MTLIEIASPTNKRPGPDRRAYEAKRQEILDSDTSLIELDLLRGGQPLIARPLVVEVAADLEPRPDYLVAINRAWQRGAELQYQLFLIRLEESLPCITGAASRGRGGAAAGPAVRFPAGVRWRTLYPRRRGLRFPARSAAPRRTWPSGCKIA